ncbi:hypothetical protein A374_10935 [Fictibacillus macauensis ZFHKF-1]|uniref:Uncharacterized protein n=1 Tax=Fictibacillus macauensis ZFHKF-1 TaxID=1196324 RepID=I8UEK7_9BACL|nr:hypothetical protein A374_10935 [Fictibacillus macauensis ZFHKF-1]
MATNDFFIFIENLSFLFVFEELTIQKIIWIIKNEKKFFVKNLPIKSAFIFTSPFYTKKQRGEQKVGRE